MKTLDELARHYDSDKWKHGYTILYDKLFTPIRNDKITLLEIGVLNGASMRMWSAYFPNAKIIGLDIKIVDERIPGVVILQGDQTDKDALVEMGQDFGPFDIVIDDGGHTMNQQQTSLGALFQFVKPGGCYVIEDLHTSFRRTYNIPIQTTTWKMIKKFQARGRIRSPSIDKEDQLFLEAQIQECVVWRHHRSMFCRFQRKEPPKEEKRPANTLTKLITEQIGEPRKGAEIGVWLGRTSIHLLKQFPFLHLHLVDCWHKGKTHETMPKNIRQLRIAWKQVVAKTKEFGNRSNVLRMPSNRAARRVKKGSLDFVFIDAEHTYESVKWDLELWYPKVRPGGLIAGHDYLAEEGLPWHREVKRAVDEFVVAHGYNGVGLAAADIWWFRKK